MENSMRHVQLYIILLHLLLTSVKGKAPAGLWGRKVVLQHSSCEYWALRPEYTLPALQELSVCVNIQRIINNSAWTAFMYRHPNGSRVELGLGGRGGLLHVWLFGRSWSPADTLTLGHWHAICISWSCSSRQAYLTVDGRVHAHAGDQAWAPDDCSLAPAGSLTLGAAHYFVDGTMQTESGTNLQGSISVFRVWSRARISTQTCSDGDVLQWHSRVWKRNDNCQAVRDDMLKCAWSLYEIKIQFLIYWFSGEMTNIYNAQEITHHWLDEKLPVNIQLNTVTVSTLESSEESHRDKGNGKGNLTHYPRFSRFDGLAQIRVIPWADVGHIQDMLFHILKEGYHSHDCNLHVFEEILHIYPTEWPDVVPKSTPKTTSTTPIPTDMPTTPTTSIITSTTSTTLIATDTTTTPTTSTTTSTTSTTLIPANTTTRLKITTAEATDSFFKVSMTLTIKGSDKDPESPVQSWIYGTLSSKGIIVLNFQITSSKPRALSLEECSDDPSVVGVQPFFPREESLSCAFQLHVPKCSNIEQTQRQIHDLLEQPYNNGTVSLDAEPDNILISYIQPGFCPQHTQQTRKGLYIWPRTSAQQVQEQPCEGDPSCTATRRCSLEAASNQAVWTDRDLHQCPTVVHSMSDLGQIIITNDTAEDVVLMLMDMQRENTAVNSHDLLITLTTLEAVLRVSVVTPKLGELVLNITSDILDSQTNLQPFTNNILNITEMVGDKMSDFNGSSLSLVARALALSVVKIDPTNFYNLTFAVTSMSSAPHPEIYINQETSEGTVAFISLPAALHYHFPQNHHTSPRIQFQFYGVPTLFNVN